MQTLTLVEISRETGKPVLAITNIQKKLKLPVPKDGYPQSYMLFIRKVSALMSFNIQSDKILELLETEKKILKLLHMDSTSGSATWYLDGCSGESGLPGKSERCLLLTGFDLGFSISGNAVQDNLNFGGQTGELFKGPEMGEDVKRILKKYRTLLEQVRQRIAIEKPALEKALRWARKILKAPPAETAAN